MVISAKLVTKKFKSRSYVQLSDNYHMIMALKYSVAALVGEQFLM